MTRVSAGGARGPASDVFYVLPHFLTSDVVYSKMLQAALGQSKHLRI